jgi:hypothetical protein
MSENESEKNSVEVESVLHMNMHTDLYSAARWALRRAKKAKYPGTRFSASMTTGLLCALTLEAYLNYLGLKLYRDDWEQLERLRPKAKLAMVARELRVRLKAREIDHEIAVDFGVRPFQTFRDLFSDRNVLAHGKVLIKRTTATQHLADDEQPTPLQLEDWKTKYTPEHAKRWRKDTKEMCQILQYAYERPFYDDDDTDSTPDHTHIDPFGTISVGSTHRIPPKQS